jgi:hypothetical protein
MAYEVPERKSKVWLKTENTKAFLLGRMCKIFIKRNEFQRCRVFLRRDYSGTDLQRVRGPERIRFDNPLSMPTHNLNRSYLRPLLPSAEKISPNGQKPGCGSRRFSAPPS